jgi:nucleoside-diphosphate-sugar epimerase
MKILVTGGSRFVGSHVVEHYQASSTEIRILDKKFVMASSAAIYGENPTVPKVETMLPEPRSPYAITKLDGEYYCDLFQREGRLHTAALRFFNVFGPRQDHFSSRTLSGRWFSPQNTPTCRGFSTQAKAVKS